jgi:RNA polymerase sigma-70 factor, ECF subfamily
LSSVPINVSFADGDVLAELYRECYPRVVKMCQRILGSSEDAEDASSEVFARLPRALETYDRARPFSPWLARVVRHYCTDLLRRRQFERRVFAPAEDGFEELPSACRSPLDELLLRERQRAVRAAMSRLMHRYRGPLALRYYRGLSYEGIALRMGLTRANAKTLVFRGRREMRLLLENPASRPAPGRKRRKVRGNVG